MLWDWRYNAAGVRIHHDIAPLPNGNVLVFDNGIGREWSRVIELDPIEEEIVWEYRASPPEDFYSRSKGSAQRLPNGNTLIADSDNGRAFEVTLEGDVVWEYVNPHQVAEGGRAAIVRAIRYERAVIDALRETAD